MQFKDIIFKFNPFNLFVFEESDTAVLYENQPSTDPGIAEEFKTYYDNRLIKKAGPNLVYEQFAVKRPLPKGRGKTVEFRGFHELDTDVASRKLEEGQTPEGQKLAMYTIPATVESYGGWVPLNDIVITTAIDPMVNSAIDVLSTQAHAVLDKLIRNAIVTDDEVNDALAGGADAEAELTVENHKISVADIRRLVNILKRVNAPKINGAYPLILHTDVATDLTADEEYKELYKFLKPQHLASGYVGDVVGARIYETTNALITTNSEGVAIYHGTLIGEGSYGTVKLEGGGLRTIIKQLGSSGTADPLDQRGSAGWKATTVTKVLIPKYLVNYRCTSSFNGVDDAEAVIYDTEAETA